MKQLDFLRELKSVTFCSVENGSPKARIIDVMFVDENKIYFTTARGKSFYRQLMENPKVAILGMDKNSRMIRIHGTARRVDHHVIDKIFELNPRMNDLYEGTKRHILEPFCVFEGRGELFDLSMNRLKRERFSLGGVSEVPSGYTIGSQCISCDKCREVCPAHCISDDYVINSSFCIECGSCHEACPADAIQKQMEF